jgi:hypothetical protein
MSNKHAAESYKGTGVNTGDTLFTTANVQHHELFTLMSSAGAVDVWVTLDGTNFSTAALALEDQGATANGTYVHRDGGGPRLQVLGQVLADSRQAERRNGGDCDADLWRWRMIDTQSDLQTVIKARNGQMVVKRTQDVTPYLEANKAARNSFSDWRPFAKQGMRQVAEIPNIVVEKWMRELGVNVFDRNHAKKVQQLLNSNEYAYLRTSPGKCKVT